MKAKLTDEQIEQIVNNVKAKHYAEAASIIAYKPDTSEVIRDAIAEVLENFQTPSPGMIIDLIEVYDKHSGSLAQLEQALAELITPSKVDSQQEEAEVSIVHDMRQLTDDQLKNSIERIKEKQRGALAKHQDLDPTLSDRLSTMLQEQQKRFNPEAGRKVILDETLGSRTVVASQEAIANYFVLPEAKDLERIKDVTVIVGSPIIDVLVEEYEKQHGKVKQYSLSELKSMSPDDRVLADRELKKQQDFVETYKNAEGKDIFVHQVASKFATDKYPYVEAVKDSNDESLEHYFFSAGRIDIKYNFENRNHTVNLVGSIPGRVAIATKRRTDSGKVVEDAYDIVEIQDGNPVFYLSSSKGNVSIANTDTIKKSVQGSRSNLAVPAPAKIGQEREINVEGMEQEQIAIAAPAKQISTEKITMQELHKVQLEESSIEESRANHLRSELQKYIQEKASVSTRNYLMKQIAEEEGKSIEEIKNEFRVESKKTEQEKIEPTPTAPQPRIDIEEKKQVVAKNNDRVEFEKRLTKVEEEMQGMVEIISDLAEVVSNLDADVGNLLSLSKRKEEPQSILSARAEALAKSLELEKKQKRAQKKTKPGSKVKNRK